MKKVLWLVFLLLPFISWGTLYVQLDSARSFSVFNRILFYDGYAKVVSTPVSDGVIRVSNAMYVNKISDEQLNFVGSSLTLDVLISPSCDNYDRIGNVSLVLSPKGGSPQDQKRLQKIELARFITPFMDKNKEPKEVKYHYELNHLASLFSDMQKRRAFDYWIEFEIFGVPYAAQKQIKGCADSIGTFHGSVVFTSNGKALAKPSKIKALWFKDSLNNYHATDTVGKTVKSTTLTVDRATKNGIIYIITSNHGANKGGEEYVRRLHKVYLNNQLVYEYTPGGISCEPFRKNNSQNNGIYGKKEKTVEEWTSWNNWCPGAPVPLREINLGRLKKGNYTLKIEVPDAKFAGQQGHILTSAYFEAI